MSTLQTFLKQYMVDHPNDVETLILSVLDLDCTWETRTREHLHKILVALPIERIDAISKFTDVPMGVLLPMREHHELVVVTPALVEALEDLPELEAESLDVMTYTNPIPDTWAPEQLELFEREKASLGWQGRPSLDPAKELAYLVMMLFGVFMDAVGEVHAEDTDMVAYFPDGTPAQPEVDDDAEAPCSCCGGEARELILKTTRGHLGTHGFSMIGVGGEGSRPRFVYSIGIPNTANAPECIVVGLPAKVAANVIHDYYDRVKAGGPLEVGKRYSEFIGGFDMQVELVDKSRYEDYLAIGIDFHGNQEFLCVQLVAPSTQGVWPWEPGAGAAYYQAQPRLSVPKTVPDSKSPEAVIVP